MGTRFTPEPYDGLPATLRHAFLWRFADAAEREAVERVGEILHRHVVESGQVGPEAGPDADAVRKELEAASADLMACADDLRTLAEDRRRGRLSVRDFDLAEGAGAWATEVAEVARRIGEAVATGEPPAR